MARDKLKPSAPTDAPSDEDARLKIFLSYSRANTEAMNRIADAMLEQGEFIPDFDKAAHDPDRVSAGISADEPWWQRLEEMIAGAETMVFLVSPASAASQVCDEEIAYAQRLGKRIVPVLAEPVNFAKLPPKLASLNIAIDFTSGGPGFDAAIAQLLGVLKVNAKWLREGRKYSERAAEWHRKGRPASGLLNAGAYEEAEAWAAKRPKNEPEPGELFADWIAESRRAIRQQIIRERRRQRRNAAIIAVMFLAAGAALWGGVQGFRELQLAKSEALLVAAEQAAGENLFDRALRFAALANEGDWLRLPHPDADGVIGEFAFRSPLEATLFGHTEALTLAVFSPCKKEGEILPSGITCAAGLMIVTASWDTTARVWQTGADGTWASTPLEGHEDNVTFAAFSPDGARIVTASWDTTARVWQTGADGAWASTPLEGHESAVWSAAFSPDGARIVTASADGTARVWICEESAWAGTQFAKYQEALKFAAFFPDGKRILTASTDGTAQVWHKGGAGTWERSVLDGHRGQLSSVALSPDGTRIVTSGYGATLLWTRRAESDWDSSSLGEEEDEYEELDGDYWSSIAFSPDGTRIVTGSFDGYALVWTQVADLIWIPSTLLEDDQSYSISSVAFSADGTRILTSDREGLARIWRQNRHGVWLSIPLEFQATSAAFSPDGARIVTASDDGTARVWDVRYLSGPEDWKRKENQTRAAAICRERMSGSFYEVAELDAQEDPASGQAPTIRRIYPDRMITEADAAAYPGIRHRVGQDACANILGSPPWWEALFFWRQR
ncbi:MAG: toll/interleukin-1 receptor domain-containing protein [Hyphomonas sp.]